MCVLFDCLCLVLLLGSNCVCFGLSLVIVGFSLGLFLGFYFRCCVGFYFGIYSCFDVESIWVLFVLYFSSILGVIRSRFGFYLGFIWVAFGLYLGIMWFLCWLLCGFCLGSMLGLLVLFEFYLSFMLAPCGFYVGFM